MEIKHEQSCEPLESKEYSDITSNLDDLLKSIEEEEKLKNTDIKENYARAPAPPTVNAER